MKMYDQEKKVRPVRQETPSDCRYPVEKWKSGQMPVGGYRSVIPMDGGKKTSGGGKKVY
jgi:hypothetical protein